MADDASLAVLMALCTESTESSGPAPSTPAIVFSRLAAARSREALELIWEAARPFRLKPLGREHTRALLGSLFGELPELDVVASWVHNVALGNPRRAMALAQHLVERGHAHFSQGSWQLPAELASLSLPTSIEDALDAQVDALGARSLRVAALLALSLDIKPLSLDELMRVSEFDDELDSDAIYDALEELSARTIAVFSGGRCRLRHAGYGEAIRRRLSEVRELHRLLALACAARGPTDLVAIHHLQCAGLDDEALERLRPELDPHRDPTSEGLFAASRAQQAHRVFLRMLDHARLTRESPDVVHGLLLRINTIASNFALEDRIDDALALLEQDLAFVPTGPLPPGVSAMERLGEALVAACARWDETRAQERGLNPINALYVATHTAGRMYARGVAALDLPLLDRAAGVLEPIAAAAPAVEALRGHVRRGESGLRGVDVAVELRAGLASLDDPPDGMDASSAAVLKIGIRHHLALLMARRGDPATGAFEYFDARPEQRDLAAAIELIVHLNHGRLAQANMARARLRALAARGLPRLFSANVLYNEAGTAALLDHVPTIKALLGPLAALAREHSGWQPVELATRAAYRSIRGQPQAALEHAEQLFRQVGAGEHLAWGIAMPHALAALCELGRIEEACRRSHAALEQARARRLEPTTCTELYALLAFSRALAGEGAAALGSCADALSLMDREGIDGAPRVAALRHCALAALAAGQRERYGELLASLDEVAARSGGENLLVQAARVRAAGQLPKVDSQTPAALRQVADHSSTRTTLEIALEVSKTKVRKRS